MPRQYLPLAGRRGDSAPDGPAQWGGGAAHRRFSRHVRRRYVLTHRARRITEADFERFDMIVVMDDMNYEAVHRLAPSRRDAEKIFRMREFFSRHPQWSYVPDPYYEGHEGFELVLDMLEDGCEGILNYIRNQARS